jgi:hypothetical protein
MAQQHRSTGPKLLASRLAALASELQLVSPRDIGGMDDLDAEEARDALAGFLERAGRVLGAYRDHETAYSLIATVALHLRARGLVDLASRVTFVEAELLAMGEPVAADLAVAS